jgi:hypothetical protein
MLRKKIIKILGENVLLTSIGIQSKKITEKKDRPQKNLSNFDVFVSCPV